MYTSIIEFASLILFVGCFYHATRYETNGFAQQWFIAGYLFGILREILMQVAFISYYYAPQILRFGAAPALVSLLWPSIFYLAYMFARRIVPAKEYIPFAALAFVIAASLVLPIQATGVQLGWWFYEEPAPLVFGGLPVTVPLVWGAGAALYYIVFEKIRATRLPDRGKTYAMISFTPIVVVVHILFTLALGFVL